MIISKSFTFEASHILPKHPGKCSRLHGHSWKLTVSVEGNINPSTGFVCDYAELSKVVHVHVIEPIDHSHLGQGQAMTGSFPVSVPYLGIDFYPSSENLCRAIFKLLQPLIKEIQSGITLSKVRIEETCTSAAEWSAVDDAASN